MRPADIMTDIATNYKPNLNMSRLMMTPLQKHGRRIVAMIDVFTRASVYLYVNGRLPKEQLRAGFLLHSVKTDYGN